ncbi:stevor PIR protein,putative [Plasmodium sp.]|nr:stevor PIR protein,putative [Plasmodium sp.]
MISCILKLIIFSIILGQLTLIYNNNCDILYKNTNNGNIALIRTNFRSLAELSYKLTTNYRHENKELKEYRNTNDKKYKKDKYQKNDTKTNQILPEVPKNENAGTSKSKKYKKAKYNKEKETQSNIFARFLNYLETLTKKFSKFFVKKYKDFLNFLDKLSDKSDKSHESTNKKKSSDKLYSSNKNHDKNLDTLKKACVGSVGACGFASPVLVNYGMLAAVAAVKGVIESQYSNIVNIVMNALVGVNIFSQAAIDTATTSIPTFSTTGLVSIPSSALQAFGPYGIAALVLILIVVALIILYIYLRKRKKKSRKH